MGREIERKFLVVGESWRDAVTRSQRMEQGYLADSEKASVRIRVAGDEARFGQVLTTLLVYRLGSGGIRGQHVTKLHDDFFEVRGYLRHDPLPSTRMPVLWT